jgi:hypothetical protein
LTTPINIVWKVFICAVFWENIKMAEKVEIDIPGIGLIEAKNAATEATLLEILKVLEGTQKDNAKNAKAAGKGGSSGSGPSKADAANMAALGVSPCCQLGRRGTGRE